MRNIISILSLFLLIIACNDQEKKSQGREDIRYEGTINTDSSEKAIDSNFKEIVEKERDGVLAEDEADPGLAEKDASQEVAGTYLHLNKGNNSCSCSCLEISFTSPTELCISPDTIYISATYEYVDNNSLKIFLAEVIKDEEEDRQIPWDEFDRNTPIATISIQADQTLKLNWLGFAIDGEIAVDYAIYGKKTLEGNYMKK